MKCVPCEHCGTEYVYVMEREGQGGGTSLYLTDEGGARDRSATGAQESLRAYLENDFDPVPCPACGHYQRYMFPKLYHGGPTWVQLSRLAALAVGCPAAVGALYWVVMCVRQPGAAALVRLGALLALLALLALADRALRAAERAHESRFDPNTEDQQARIAKGRSRARTRAEVEAAQQRERDVRDQFIEYLRQKAREDRAERERPAPPGTDPGSANAG